MLKLVYYFFTFLQNNIIQKIPIYFIRRLIMRLLGMTIGRRTVLNMNQYILRSERISIGDYSHINQGCLLDGRGCLSIGNSVSISFNVKLLTGSHKVNDEEFVATYKSIKIDDFVWIGANAIILQGCTIGEGAVVAAGSVVSKNVEPYTIVGGIPARAIGLRNTKLNYRCKWNIPFF